MRTSQGVNNGPGILLHPGRIPLVGTGLLHSKATREGLANGSGLNIATECSEKTTTICHLIEMNKTIMRRVTKGYSV